MALDAGAVSAALTDRATALSALRTYCASVPAEGFEQGVHDEDASEMLMLCAPIIGAPGGYTSTGRARAAALVFRHQLSARDRSDAEAAIGLLRALGASSATSRTAFVDRYREQLQAALEVIGADPSNGSLVEQVVDAILAMGNDTSVTRTAYASAGELRTWTGQAGVDLRTLDARALRALVADRSPVSDADVVAEITAALLVGSVTDSGLPHSVSATGLRSQGPGIVNGMLDVPLGRRMSEWRAHRQEGVGRFGVFDQARRSVVSKWRDTLEVDRLRPRVLSGFVRNRLVDDVLLPIVGDAFAKQMGLAGPAQGLLLLISPPGYGKTTLVEYLADLLGFALVKINGPALGTEVTSLDPGAAPDASSAAEVTKLNRAFAMGTNTICYLDDIQHVSPEFLQRFIPLCDGTRRIEGVFEGSPRSYSLSGKRFVMVMAGNPYTSSGAEFRIPDMLANRADVHNLGDIVGGDGSPAANAFAQSYIENACAANTTLAPLFRSGRADLEVLLRAVATNAPVPSNELQGGMTDAEVASAVKVLGQLSRVRDVLLKVNRAYIDSARMDDAQRGEPPFLLQGSYRNMARIAQKIVPAMTTDEVDRTVIDHYRTESQTLATSGTWNLAKWRVVVGSKSPQHHDEVDELRTRWREANRHEDPAAAVVSALQSIEAALRSAVADGGQPKASGGQTNDG